MKKIFLTIVLMIPMALSAQYLSTDWDSITHTNSGITNNYLLLFNKTTDDIYGMSIEYALPWLFNGSNIITPRSTSHNLSLGSVLNPYNDKLYIVGAQRTTGNAYFSGRIYLGPSSYLSFNVTTNQLSLSDPITGSRTLAQLDAGGSASITEGNMINVVNGASTEVLVDPNVIYYNPAMAAIYTGTIGSATYNIDQSSTGQYIIAAGKQMGIRKSNDYGATFTTFDSLRAYEGVSMSNTGQYILIGDGNGYQLRSNNYGATFINMPDSLGFYFTDISTNGKYQVGCWGDDNLTTGYVYQSSDYGATFRRKDLDFAQIFSDIEISDNGKYLSATTLDCDYCPETGGVWVSSDSGVTWTQKLMVGDLAKVAMSGDGHYQLATGYNYKTYRSVNYGATWSDIGIAASDADISNNGKDQILQTASSIRMSGDYGVTWYVVYTDTYNGDQQISLSSEGANLLYSEGLVISRYNADDAMEIRKPFTALKEAHFQDSLTLDLYDNGYDQWLLVNASGTLVADSLGASGFMNIKANRSSISEFFTDMRMVNGLPEFAWSYMDKSGKIVKTYDLPNIKRPTYQVQALQATLERNLWYTYELKQELDALKKEYDIYKKSIEYRLQNIEADLKK